MINFSERFGEFTAVIDDWNIYTSESYICKAIDIFTGISDLVFEFWPNTGQLILWEGGYKNKRRPLAVNITVDLWADEYSHILQDSETDEESEVRASAFENKVITTVKPFIEKNLGSCFKIKYFITNEDEII